MQYNVIITNAFKISKSQTTLIKISLDLFFKNYPYYYPINLT